MNIEPAELRAQDVMTRDPVCVTPATGLRDLAQTFRDNEISGVPVIDAQGALLGVVSKTDLLKYTGEAAVAPAFLFEVLSDQAADPDEQREFEAEPDVHVADVMTEDPLTAAPATPVSVLARIMFEHRVHRVVIIDPGRVRHQSRSARCLPRLPTNLTRTHLPRHRGGKEPSMNATLKHHHRPVIPSKATPAPPLPLRTPHEGSVSPDRIRRRAYEIFRARKGEPGDALTDWLQAEREMSDSAALEQRWNARGEAMLTGDD